MSFRRCGLFFIVFCVVSTGAQTPLRTFADKNDFNFGVAVGTYYTHLGTQYNEILNTQFNTIVCENEMKPLFTQPEEGTFTFESADSLVTLAAEKNMKMRGHCLVWHNQAPDWLMLGTWTRETLLAAMKTHIDSVMNHYKGQCYEWDVVNEAFEDDDLGILRETFWKTTIGEDFMDSAFAYAHAADPDAILYYNDYGTTIRNIKSDALYNKVKEMVENGVPIHGIGFQSHLAETDCYDELYDDIMDNFKRFADLGLKIAVTEFDVKIELPSDSEKLRRQAQVYGAALRASLATPTCNTFIIWGFTDKNSWIPYSFPGFGEGLFYDSLYAPKPAYDTIYKILSEWNVGVKRNIRGKRTVADGIEITNMSNNISVRNVNTNRSSVCELYNLRGARSGAFSIAAGEKRSLSGMMKSRGTVIVKAGNKAEMIRAVR